MQKTVLVILLVLTLLSIGSLLFGSDALFTSLAVVKNGTLAYDIDNDGNLDHLENWDRGVLLSIHQDSNDDGEVDSISRFRDQELWQTEYDLDLDGEFDYRETWEENGRHRIEIIKEGKYQTVDTPIQN